MSDFNILFSCSGRRVSLIRSFRAALETLGLRGSIVATDLKRSSPASFVADHRELTPPVNSPSYIGHLKQLCKRYGIKLVVPLIDTELHILANHVAEFAAEGTTLLVCSPGVSRICFDKRSTHAFFRENDIPTAEVLSQAEALAAGPDRYPLILKPATGSASVGVSKLANRRELEFYLEQVENPVVQEFLTGQEYTIDVLVDFQHRVRCVVPRLRIETRAGEISKGVTVRNPALIAAATRVCEALPGAVGCITVQCFLTPQGEIKFTEINPRFGGGVPLTIRSGADYPRWIIEWVLGREVEIAPDAWKDGLCMLRYDEAIFVDQGLIS
jgi:carbamoyl-phosphate synthase large subunit